MVKFARSRLHEHIQARGNRFRKPPTQSQLVWLHAEENQLARFRATQFCHRQQVGQSYLVGGGTHTKEGGDVVTSDAQQRPRWPIREGGIQDEHSFDIFQVAQQVQPERSTIHQQNRFRQAKALLEAFQRPDTKPFVAPQQVPQPQYDDRTTADGRRRNSSIRHDPAPLS